MRKFLLSAISGLFVFVSLCPIPTGHAFNGKATKPSTGAKPASAKTAASKKGQPTGPFTLLTFKQVARLEYTQRVKYVRQLRRMALDIEKAQFMFRDSIFNYSLLNDSPERRNLYAVLFGDFAEAADSADCSPNDPNCPHKRGANPFDRCIYAYNVSSYKTDGRGGRKPFECDHSAFDCRVTGQNKQANNGVQCGPLSGISKCIQDHLRHKSTEECERLRQDLEDRNKPQSTKVIEDVRKYFKLKKDETITAAELTAPAAIPLLKSLADAAYDDGVYAELIKVLSLYKNFNVALPKLDAVGENARNLLYAYDRINPEKFENDFNVMQNSMNQIFHDAVAHCDRNLDEKEIQIIRSYKAPKKKKGLDQTSRGAAELELRRKEAADHLALAEASKKRKTFKVSEILETKECEFIKRRVNSIHENLERTVSSYPVFSDDKPGFPATDGGAATDSTPPSSEPTPSAPTIGPPNAPSVAEQNVFATGCSAAATSDKHQLYHPAARCAVCLAERAEIKHTEKPYTVSKKWLSLMSTMVIACGDGVYNNQDIRVDTMVQYLQTFGHCSTEDYEWNLNDPLDNDERHLIENWSKTDYWDNTNTNKEKRKADKVDDKFHELYGISYLAATKAFCSPERFQHAQNDILNVAAPEEITGIVKDFDKSVTTTQPLFDRRKKFNNLLKTGRLNVYPDDKIKNSIADKLLDCMKSSAARAEKIYSGSSNSCVQTVRFNRDGSTTRPGAFSKMFDDLKKNGASILFNNGTCSIPMNYQLPRPGKDESPVIGFIDPNKIDLDDPDAPYRQITCRPKDESDLGADRCGFVDFGKEEKTNPLGLDRSSTNEGIIQEYSFTVPDPKACMRRAHGSSTDGGRSEQ